MGRTVKRGPQDAAPTGHEVGTRCMGCSRGGLTTKIHALVDPNGMPVALKLTEGQAHDGRSAADMLGEIGTDQTRLADRAYDSDALRQRLAERGAWANIKPMPNRVNLAPHSAPSSTAAEISSNTSSTNSNNSEPSPPGMKNMTQTTWLSLNSLPLELAAIHELVTSPSNMCHSKTARTQSASVSIGCSEQRPCDNSRVAFQDSDGVFRVNEQELQYESIESQRRRGLHRTPDDQRA